jgi:hypothetical protein
MHPRSSATVVFITLIAVIAIFPSFGGRYWSLVFCPGAMRSAADAGVRRSALIGAVTTIALPGHNCVEPTHGARIKWANF